MAKKKAPKGTAAKIAGTPGKLHRRLGVPIGEPIPAAKLAKARRSKDPSLRREAINAGTLKRMSRGRRSSK